MAVATLDEAPPPKRGASLVVQIGVLVAMTAVAIGGGWFAGNYLRGEPQGDKPAAAAHGEPAGGHGEAPADHGEAAGAALHPMIIPLAPITTNIAQPSDIWVRMEVALLFEKAPEDRELADKIHQDFLAYIRTLKLHQISGASGFQHLRQDLEERASLRSDGQTKAILIRTLLFE